MSFRPLLIVIAAGSLTGLAVAQTSNSILESTKTNVPAVLTAEKLQADKPETPVLSPELRGDIFMARKEYREAIESFKKGSPTDPVLWNKTGIAYHQMMQMDNALKSYEKAVKLKRDYLEAINNIGTVYYARKNYRRAITYYQRALKIAPKSYRMASIYSNMGTALFARKRYKEANDAMQTAMQLDPEVFEHRGTYGILLEERNVEERAKYHYYLAKLYAKDGRTDMALQYLRKSLEEGLKERKQLDKDPEFASMRESKEFKDLLALEPRVL